MASQRPDTDKKAFKRPRTTAPAAAVPRGVTRKTTTQRRRDHRGQFVPASPPRTSQPSRTPSPEFVEEAPPPSSSRTRKLSEGLSEEEIIYLFRKLQARKSRSHNFRSLKSRSHHRRHRSKPPSSPDTEESDPPESWYHQNPLSRAAARLLWWGLDPKTRKSYHTSITAYGAHCAVHALHPPFPATLESLASWVSELSAKKVKAETIKFYLADIKSAHVDMGFEDLGVPFCIS